MTIASVERVKVERVVRVGPSRKEAAFFVPGGFSVCWVTIIDGTPTIKLPSNWWDMERAGVLIIALQMARDWVVEEMEKDVLRAEFPGGLPSENLDAIDKIIAEAKEEAS
jgi:hypothetical protein